MPPKKITLPEDATLQAARDAVEFGRTGREGVICPCCDQQATMYRRKVTAAMAKVLLALYCRDLTAPGAWVRIPSLLSTMKGADGQGGDWGKLAHWDLVEKGTGKREDGSSRTGYARITSFGRKFAARGARILQIAHVFNDKCFGYDGPLVTIDDCLGKENAFLYNEILSGVSIPEEDTREEPTEEAKFFESLI